MAIYKVLESNEEIRTSTEATTERLNAISKIETTSVEAGRRQKWFYQ